MTFAPRPEFPDRARWIEIARQAYADELEFVRLKQPARVAELEPVIRESTLRALNTTLSDIDLEPATLAEFLPTVPQLPAASRHEVQHG